MLKTVEIFEPSVRNHEARLAAQNVFDACIARGLREEAAIAAAAAAVLTQLHGTAATGEAIANAVVHGIRRLTATPGEAAEDRVVGALIVARERGEGRMLFNEAAALVEAETGSD